MASQHFYSRVPARVSMYNKYDGYDTFAHSQNLTREFVEKDLAIVYQDKLSKNDMPLVRRGEINPVYYHCNVKSGKLVQGCISYLPLDYTGERSAYFTHSLVFTDEECNKLLGDESNTIFNSDVFKTDISEFDITSPNASPNNEYPELDYVTKPLNDIQGIYEKYNPETVKNFIGSILFTLCKKGKPVYFKVDVDDANASKYALDFICEIMSVLPQPFRQGLSFVTYLNDYTQFPSFKLKCVSSKCPEIYQEKGVFFDFKIDLSTGLDTGELRNNQLEINFLYSLLQNNEMRVEFLRFVKNAIETLPALQNLNLKILSDLIFLFQGTCGFFRERSIIPNDDTVLSFFSVYEKYREVLTDEYRVRAYKVLYRYADIHEAIPKPIFQKLAKLYATDIKPARRIAMEIVLELIHTDIMRDKLFVFISNNYEKEDEETKRTINMDLCRVFYGGFMQPQILKFFASNFSTEPIETQDQILERLLLTIRTISIQAKILEFIDMHYDVFTNEQREKIYQTFFEMIPECDALSEAIVKMINKHSVKEHGYLLDEIKFNIVKKLEADYHKKESNLLPILINERGLCFNTIMELIFSDWYQRKVYNHFIDLLKIKDPVTKTNMLLDILQIVPNMTADVKLKLLDSVTNLYENDYSKSTVYTWIDLFNLVAAAQKESQNEVLNRLANDEIFKGIDYRLYDVFDTKLNPNGMDIIVAFAKENNRIGNCSNYKCINDFITIINNVKNNNFDKAFEMYDALPMDKKLRATISNYVLSNVIDRSNQTYEQTICLDIFVSHLKEEKVFLDKLYLQYKDAYKRQYNIANGNNANPKKAVVEACENTMVLLINCCQTISQNSAVLTEVICNDESKLKFCVEDFVTNYGSKAKKWIQNEVSKYEENKFTEYLNKQTNESKSQGGSFLKNLFSKK